MDDLIQETYLKLCADHCRSLLDFSTRHPQAIVGYIKTIAINVAHDHFKAQHSQKRGSGDAGESIEDIEPKASSGSLGGPDAMEQEILFNQIHQCLQVCTAGPEEERDCLIFWLYYQQGMSAKAIAGLPTVNLSAKGVESALLRLTRCVREKIVGLKLPPAENIKPYEKGFRSPESFERGEAV